MCLISASSFGYVVVRCPRKEAVRCVFVVALFRHCRWLWGGWEVVEVRWWGVEGWAAFCLDEFDVVGVFFKCILKCILPIFYYMGNLNDGNSLSSCNVLLSQNFWWKMGRMGINRWLSLLRKGYETKMLSTVIRICWNINDLGEFRWEKTPFVFD